MADYYPLLSRALSNLGEAAGPDVRRAIFDRARTSLMAQLERAEPPLSADQIERERALLEAVIARLEMEARSRSKPASHLPRRFVKELSGQSEDDGSEADEIEQPSEPEVSSPPAEEDHGDSVRHEELAEPAPTTETPVPPPPSKWRRIPGIDWRVLALAIIGVVVVGSLAGLAYVLRDQVDPVRREQAEQAANNPEGSSTSPDAKIPTRLSGAAAPSSAPEAPGKPTTLPGADQQLAVSQRATLFLEVPGAADQVPRTVAGRVVWRFANLPGKAGQPLDPALVGTVEIPDAGITMRLQITRNRDASLPASYLIGLVFTTKESTVKEIAPVLMKTDESERGAPLIGIQQPLGPNLFVMALSNADADIAKNFDLLTKRPWMETQFRLADQRRGALVFEKGLAGDRALLAAIDAWK
ncbi:MAG TPA: hypothetical protein VK433_03490 [Stellaceae bacterium]|nr:hypothetical protein [Stellaceae bacterium]